MGTVSAGNVAALLKEGSADGLVLTSSVTTSGRKMNESLEHVRLEDIILPTLIVHHESDGCQITRYSDAYALLKRFKRAPRKSF